MRETIRKTLFEMAEKDYKKFSSALIPGADNLIGVRLPQLREMAKKIAKDDWRTELAEQEDLYFEEVMLRGMVIGYSNTDIEEKLTYISEFIPLVNNWSVCDSFCVSLHAIQKNRERVWEYLQKYLHSEDEFEVRVGVIILLDHYIKCDENEKTIPRKRVVLPQNLEQELEPDGKYIENVLKILDREYSQGYYAQMAAAWTMAEAFCTFPYKTMKVLKNSSMDEFTYKKTLQKICESRIPSDEVKQVIKGMRG